MTASFCCDPAPRNIKMNGSQGSTLTEGYSPFGFGAQTSLTLHLSATLIYRPPLPGSATAAKKFTKKLLAWSIVADNNKPYG
jgi:hypothetical protein